MNRFITTAALVLALTGGIQREASGAESASDSGQSYAARGVVREVAADRRKAVIRHEAITNYMPAMTMEFSVRDTNELTGVVAGDMISFRLTATEDTHWIDQIRKLGAARKSSSGESARTETAEGAELKPGDPLPDCEFLAEDGRTVRLSDFRGRVLAITFFFTRCPLPDFCPRMNNNFSKARDLVASSGASLTNWQFLSISFDPEFDQPGVLASYANFYRGGSPDHWLFGAASTNTLAVLAPRLGLVIQREGGSISHNLRTVVVDPRGRIYRQFNGNEWRPAQLAAALLEAARTEEGP